MNTNLISTDYIELEPIARDYKSAKDATAGFRASHDFTGGYQIGFQRCNIQDFAPGTKVLLRYSRNTRVTSVKV